MPPLFLRGGGGTWVKVSEALRGLDETRQRNTSRLNLYLSAFGATSSGSTSAAFVHLHLRFTAETLKPKARI